MSRAIACDKWDSIRDNLHAVAKTIEALRGIDRWGTGEMVDAGTLGDEDPTSRPLLTVSDQPKIPRTDGQVSVHPPWRGEINYSAD